MRAACVLCALAAGLAGLVACGDNTTRTADAVVVSPTAVTLRVGDSATLSAAFVFDADTTPAATATWSSSDPAIAELDPRGATAAVIARAPGTVSITAGGLGAAAAIEVTVLPPALAALAITPPSPRVAAGTTMQLAATATYGDGSTADVTTAVTWTSTTTQIATIDAAGVAAGVVPGSTTIVAQLGSVSAIAALGVDDAPVTSLALSPTADTVPLGHSRHFDALATFADGAVRNVTLESTWTSSDETIATIFAAGDVWPVTLGTATIIATFGALTASASLEVTPADLVGLLCDLSSFQTEVGQTIQLTATGFFSDSSTSDITELVTWQSQDPLVADVAPGGLLTAIAEGGTLIEARAETKFGIQVDFCFVQVVPATP
jgi:trimeric autotransporter adhesin